MGISNTAFEQLRREYDEKQLNAQRALRARIREIEERVPEVGQLSAGIAALCVERATRRIRGEAEEDSAFEVRRSLMMKRRQELLEAAGFSADDLVPHYECSECRDTGYIGNEKCRCLKSRIIDLLYDQSNIKEVLKTENFNSFTFKYYSDIPISPDTNATPYSIAREAYALCRNFVNHFSAHSDNLFISGETGTGKTFLCNCIAKEILDMGYEVIYLSAVKLFGILADRTFSGNRKEYETADELFGCDLLVIDDLGTEYANSFTQSAFFNCINERLLRKKHTILSTNLSIAQIREEYSERIFSRILEKYTMLKLYGEDIRILKKMED